MFPHPVGSSSIGGEHSKTTLELGTFSWSYQVALGIKKPPKKPKIWIYNGKPEEVIHSSLSICKRGKKTIKTARKIRSDLCQGMTSQNLFLRKNNSKFG